MRRFLLTVAAAATTLASTACDSTGIGADVAGSYELISINGQGLPVNDGSTTIVGGVLEFDNDGTFADIVQVRDFGDPLVRNIEQFGTWDRNGDEIRLDYDTDFTLFAERRSSSRIVLDDSEGNDWEYRRF
jgi:hypothetical protein